MGCLPWQSGHSSGVLSASCQAKKRIDSRIAHALSRGVPRQEDRGRTTFRDYAHRQPLSGDGSHDRHILSASGSVTVVIASRELRSQHGRPPDERNRSYDNDRYSSTFLSVVRSSTRRSSFRELTSTHNARSWGRCDYHGLCRAIRPPLADSRMSVPCSSRT